MDYILLEVDRLNPIERYIHFTSSKHTTLDDELLITDIEVISKIIDN
jgi:hypothetical protein